MAARGGTAGGRGMGPELELELPGAECRVAVVGSGERGREPLPGAGPAAGAAASSLPAVLPLLEVPP